METRPISGVPAAPLVPTRGEAASVREAVRTDMPPPAAVSAQVGAEQTRWAKDQRQPGDKPQRAEASFETDRETGELVYKVIDTATKRVLMQYPYEAVLKLRAYIDDRTRPHAEATTSLKA